MIDLRQRIKQVAAIHDLSGFGRCSLTAAIPILSAMGIRCCPMPTAILSSQTGYPGFTYLDFTGHMPAFIDHWEELGLSFDTIYSGFLGSVGQIDIVSGFIRRFRGPRTLIAVDPVMGDNGAKYPTFSDEMCARMRELVRLADIVFPNLTEASLLTGREISLFPQAEEIDAMADELSALGPKKVIVTGIVTRDLVANYVYDFVSGEKFRVESPYNQRSYSGTGDLFASVVCGGLTRGEPLENAVRRAAGFIGRAVEATEALEADPREGVAFECLLKELAP